MLLVLWGQETATLRDLGAALHLDSATLSPVVKRLERAGLVTRRRGERDERLVDVTITEAGRRLRPGASAAQRAVEQATGLDPIELATLRDQLNELAARTRRLDLAS